MAKPVKTFRLGFVKAAIWQNDSGYHNVTIIRSYKDGNGDWKDGGSFGAGDLLNVAKVAERAEQWVSDQESD